MKFQTVKTMDTIEKESFKKYLIEILDIMEEMQLYTNSSIETNSRLRNLREELKAIT